jgi:CRISPR type I-E-associated protein CasB/Cse2
MSEPREEAERLLAFLQKNKDDRGIMADLRAGFSEATEHRAWPHIAPYCPLKNDFKRRVVQTVAAGFATQPECAGKGNLGTTMRAIAGDTKDGLASFEGRFRRLLTCVDTEELCRLVPGIIRTAKAKGVPVNHAQLYGDLCYWNGGRTKIEWAEAYWGTAGGGE